MLHCRDKIYMQVQQLMLRTRNMIDIGMLRMLINFAERIYDYRDSMNPFQKQKSTRKDLNIYDHNLRTLRDSIIANQS